MNVYENLMKQIEIEKQCAIACQKRNSMALVPLFTNEVDQLKKIRDEMFIEEAILEA